LLRNNTGKQLQATTEDVQVKKLKQGNKKEASNPFSKENVVAKIKLSKKLMQATGTFANP
jgi:hypothetical protein